MKWRNYKAIPFLLIKFESCFLLYISIRVFKNEIEFKLNQRFGFWSDAAVFRAITDGKARGFGWIGHTDHWDVCF